MVLHTVNVLGAIGPDRYHFESAEMIASRIAWLMVPILIGLAQPLGAEVYFASGSQLAQACRDPQQSIACTHFIVGAYDAAVAVSKKSCGPENMKYGQLDAVVRKYLNDHPAEQHLSAAELVLRSLKDAFGCDFR
jgi:hypothetical protein